VISALWLSACATSPPETQTLELQQTAMQRWKACLFRHSNADKLAEIQLPELINNQCEGHKRDVIALFPPHQAKQVDQILISNAYRYIDTTHKPKVDPDEYGSVVRTLLR